MAALTPLSDALTAAQRHALATLEKAYVAGAIEAEPMGEAMEACGITDAVDRSFLLASLDVLKEWGVTAPTMTERVARENGEPEKASDKQLDALVAENQQLREALEKVAALDGGEWGARMIASTALDGSPDA